MVPTSAIVVGGVHIDGVRSAVHSSTELWIGHQQRLPRNGGAGIWNQSSERIRDSAGQVGVGILHGLCTRTIGIHVLVRKRVQVTRNLNVVTVVANVIRFEDPSAPKLPLKAQ